MKPLILPLALAILSPFGLMAENISVHVDGMVCGFCSQGLTKTFNKESVIENVHVDLENKVVHLTTKSKGDFSDQRIGEIIKDAGFKLRNIERN